MSSNLEALLWCGQLEITILELLGIKTFINKINRALFTFGAIAKAYSYYNATSTSGYLILPERFDNLVIIGYIYLKLQLLPCHKNRYLLFDEL